VLAFEFGIRRRSLYDFLGICATFGLCRRISSSNIDWHSLNHAMPKINAIRIEAQNETADIKAVFDYNLDASLQRIAVGLIKLFFYLSVKFLDLRQVSRMFAQQAAKYKTMLRKVYTVAGSLEIVGFVKKTNAVSEIQLEVPLHSENCEGGLNVSSILNSEEQLEHQRVCARRLRAFEAVCLEFEDAEGIAVKQGLQAITGSE
jgi:hypothetical protein